MRAYVIFSISVIAAMTNTERENNGVCEREMAM